MTVDLRAPGVLLRGTPGPLESADDISTIFCSDSGLLVGLVDDKAFFVHLFEGSEDYCVA